MTTDHCSDDSACGSIRGWPGLGTVRLRSTDGSGPMVLGLTRRPESRLSASLDHAHVVAAAATGGAGVPGGAGHAGGHGGGDALVEDAGDDVLGAELAPTHAGGQPTRRRELHVVI